MPLTRSFIERRPVTSYLALTFAISWGGVLTVAAVGGIGGRPAEPGALLPLEILAMLAGPSVAGVVSIAVLRGREGLRDLVSRLCRWRVGARWYAVALLAAPVVTTSVLLALSLASPVFLPGVVATDDRLRLVAFAAAAGLVVGALEELGWTGFALPELRRRHGVVESALVVGVFWGAWHVLPADVLASGGYSGSLSPEAFVFARAFVLLVGALPAYRLLMARVYERTGSLLVAMLMHASLAACSLAIEPLAISGGALLVSDVAMAAAWWLVVVAVAALRGGRAHLPGRGHAYAHR